MPREEYTGENSLGLKRFGDCGSEFYKVASFLTGL
jgi:hypothetical protein